MKNNVRSQEIKFILDSLVKPNNDLLVALLTEYESGVPNTGISQIISKVLLCLLLCPNLLIMLGHP